MEIDLKKIADLESSRDYARVIQVLHSMLEQSQEAPIRLRLAMMLLKTGQIDSALEHFQLCSQGDESNHIVSKVIDNNQSKSQIDENKGVIDALASID